MKSRVLLLLVTALPLLQGCAGLFVAGAATTASIANDRRSFGSVIDDQNIELKAANAIATRTDITKASRISATAINGKVLLVGQAPYAQYSRDAEKLVARVSGVRHVFNEIRISKPLGFGQQSTDTWITSKVKSQMLAKKGMDSTRFKVVTENGEVFLMGLVTREEAERAVNLTRKISGVRQVIKVFEYIQSDGKTAASSSNQSEATAVSTSSNDTTTGGDVQVSSLPDESTKF